MSHVGSPLQHKSRQCASSQDSTRSSLKPLSEPSLSDMPHGHAMDEQRDLPRKEKDTGDQDTFTAIGSRNGMMVSTADENATLFQNLDWGDGVFPSENEDGPTMSRFMG